MLFKGRTMFSSHGWESVEAEGGLKLYLGYHCEVHTLVAPSQL